jgi:hypothetical protein
MKCKVEDCPKEATMEIINIYTNGEKTVDNYCTQHGKPIYRALFREMYGLSPKK